MARAKQESETRYRIVVDTPIPPAPSPLDYESQYWKDYSAITFLAAYTGRDYETIKGARQVINSCAKSRGKHSCWQWGAPDDPDLYAWHIEKAEVVWDWQPVDRDAKD